MRRIPISIAVLAALALAADASAGCFATAGVKAPPAGIGPGDTWKAAITVKQHGVRPIPDAKPTLTIVNESGKETTFAAKPTGTVGVYVASVVFPAKGRWTYVVNDGFVGKDDGQTWNCSTNHTFAAVDVGGPAPTPPAQSSPAPAPSAAPEPAAAPLPADGSDWVLPVLLAAAVVALAAAGGIGLARRLHRRAVGT
jgi:hypothetical protein